MIKTVCNTDSAYPVRKIAKKEYLQRKNLVISKMKDNSILVIADRISNNTGMVNIILKDGTILVGKSLGFEADFDTDGNQLPTNVLCFESFVSGGVYIITEGDIEDVA